MPPLDKALWRSLSPLLDQALDLEPPAREDLIAGLGRDSPALAEALRELVADHERLLASPFLETSLDLESDSQTTLAGYRIGAYTLDRPIGVGGMGAVWLARRSDGRFEGSAAVKLLNLAILDRLSEERFRREVGARLSLFLQVADAVAHAHANLVVHRDLKPSSIPRGLGWLRQAAGRQPPGLPSPRSSHL
jgi:serine/threonine-protein kinase